MNSAPALVKYYIASDDLTNVNGITHASSLLKHAPKRLFGDSIELQFNKLPPRAGIGLPQLCHLRMVFNA